MLIAKKNLTNFIAGSIFWAVLFIIGLLMIASKESNIQIYGTIFSTFIIFIILHYYRVFRDGMIEISINGAGIINKSWSVKRIPWSDFRSLSIRQNHRRKYILAVVDQEIFPSRNIIIRMMNSPYMTISPHGTDKNIDQVISAISLYRNFEK